MRLSRRVIGVAPVGAAHRLRRVSPRGTPDRDSTPRGGPAPQPRRHPGGADAFADFGFDPGPIDGIYTAQTQAAVRGYQARYGLPVSGMLDYATRLELLPGLDFQHSAR